MCFAALILTVINYVSDQAMQDVLQNTFMVRSAEGDEVVGENKDAAAGGEDKAVVNEEGDSAKADEGE